MNSIAAIELQMVDFKFIDSINETHYGTNLLFVDQDKNFKIYTLNNSF